MLDCRTLILLPALIVLGCGAPDVGVSQPEPGPSDDDEVNELVWKLVDPDPEVVLATIDEVAWLDDPKATAGLLGCLDYNDEAVVEKAIVTIVKLGRPGSVADIIYDYPKNWPLERTAELMKDLKYESVPEVGLVLLDGDDDQRLLAAMVLSKSRSMAAWEAQVEALSDPLDEVKIWAMGPLGLAKQAEAFEPIVELLGSDNPEVVIAAARALGDMKRSEALPRLVDVLVHPDREVVSAAEKSIERLFKLSDEAGREEATALLVTMAGGDSARGRAGAASMLGKLGGPEHIQILAKLLGDDDEDVQHAAEHGIRAICSNAEDDERAQVLEILGKLVVEGEPVLARTVALDILVEMEGDAVLPLVQQMLKDDEIAVCLQAFEAMIALGEEVPDKVIAKLLGHESTVKQTVHVLFDEDLLTKKIVSLMLRSPHALARAVGADALLLVDEKGAPKKLIKLLTDEDADVRRHAVKGLAKLGTPAAIGPLAKLLGDEALDQEVFDALVSFGEDAEKPVIKALGSKDTSKVLSALRVLGQIGSLSSIKPMIELLDHDDPDVRSSAAFTLENLTCGGQGSDPDAWLDWYAEQSGKHGFCWKQKQEMVQGDDWPPHP